MKHNYASKKILLLLIGLLTFTSAVQAQFTEWTGSGDWTVSSNWSAGYFYAQLEWKGAGSATSNNDATGGASHQWRLFFSGGSSYTITGNEVRLFDFGGAPSWVLSESSADQTLETDIEFADVGARPAWITTRSTGKFILGNLDIAGGVTDLRIASLDTSGDVIINGDITGSVPVVIGKDELNATQPNTRVEYMSACTYSGATVIEGGILTLSDDLLSSDVTVKSGANLDIAGNVTIKSLLVEAGGVVNVTPGNALIVDGTTDNSGEIILQSTSTSYSSFIPDSYTGLGTVVYNRFVNSSTGGNDLVSPPVSGETWSDFLSSGTNEADLLDDGNVGPTTYAFGPFDKTASDYVNYNDGTSATLMLGTGYRAATDSGTTLTFSGSVSTITEAVDIIVSGTSFAEWNLIGNTYPSYLDIKTFLEHEVSPGVSNISLFESASGIYGYDGDASDGWNVITLANDDGKLFAPGQGFFVAADAADVVAHDVEFTPAMRTPGSDDDFVLGRNSSSNLTFSKINISTATSSYNTEVYFDANASLGLDPGYDAAIFGGSAPAFSIYSHLVQDNTGIPIALQAVGLTDVTNVTIPLGINANAGEELTFDMSFFSLPANVEVYLDDNVESTSTLLNSSDYVITPSSNLNGTGRFFLRFIDNSLSTPENSLESLSIYTNQGSRSIHVAGQLLDNTIVNVYDIQGRLILSKALDSDLRSQSIDAQSLGTGIYVVELSNGNQNKVEKIILK